MNGYVINCPVTRAHMTLYRCPAGMQNNYMSDKGRKKKLMKNNNNNVQSMKRYFH